MITYYKQIGVSKVDKISFKRTGYFLTEKEAQADWCVKLAEAKVIASKFKKEVDKLSRKYKSGIVAVNYYGDYICQAIEVEHKGYIFEIEDL